MDVAQAGPYISAATYDYGLNDFEDVPSTEEPVNILGTSYSAIHERNDIKNDIRSRLWFTYRRGFAPIGGEGPSSDAGWGCMLRCGQMMLAEALVRLHLSRDWRWKNGKNHHCYYEILKMFLDLKTACYSIHQISNMGVSEGKPVGEWMGPNTIAQVLKKLAVYDTWSKLVIHVALDNTVVKQDLVSAGQCNCQECISKLTRAMFSPSPTSVHTNPSSDFSTRPLHHRSDDLHSPMADTGTLSASVASECSASSSKSVTDVPEWIPVTGLETVSTCGDGQAVGGTSSVRRKHWRPVLLIIPLRLGLSEINPLYFNAIKNCFVLRQSLGLIGGRPNQAYWFIGAIGNELIYLDPHTNQPFEDMADPNFADESFHCPYICRMDITSLDPSIALGFLCTSEEDLNDCLLSIKKFILHAQKAPMFEIYDQRPQHWPQYEQYSPEVGQLSDFETVDRQYDTDEEFELI